jgi:hypothetical protein
MEPTRSLKRTYQEDDASEDAATSDRRVATRIPPTESHHLQGHRFEAVTTQDNARVHMGDVHQYNHYHEAPPSQSKAKEISLPDALAFEQMDFRSATIAPAYSKTCDWLFSAAPYMRWRDQDLVSEHNGFLWIKGKPGAGKSTVMKHAWQHARATYDDEKTMSFFFNARGTALGKSVEGMYRCLLLQMEGQVPHLSSRVAIADRSVYRSTGWPVAILQDLFRQGVLHLCRETKLNCYIDALDEGDDEDQVREMVEFFYELAERAVPDGLAFRVCLASRYYPKISVRTSEELRLEDQAGHDTDISNFVHKKLRLRSGQLKERLASEIKRRSSGVFLWVVLVVAILNRESDHGNHHLIEEQLHNIPNGLLQLFEELLTRSGSDSRFFPAIQWVLYAVRPLEPAELYIAVLIGTSCACELNAEGMTLKEQLFDAETVDDFILSSSKGLLEVRDLKVQFIHETVREYFLTASQFRSQIGGQAISKNNSVGIPTLDSRSSDDDIAAISHVRLSQICQTFIRMLYASDVQPEMDIIDSDSSTEYLDKLPFLRYSVEMALCHADTASKNGRRVSNLAQNFPWKEWVSYKTAGYHVTPDHPWYCMSTWLQKMTFEEHTHLLKDELSSINANDNRPQQGKEEERESHSLLNACVEGLGSALHLSVLGGFGWKVNGRLCTPDFVDQSRQFAFHPKGGSTECLRLLLDGGANVNVRCKGVSSPLHVAASLYRHDHAVRLLLEFGADATLMDDYDNTALHYAIMKQNMDTIKALLTGGVSATSIIGVHGTIAQTAGQFNDWRFMQELSEAGIDVNVRDFGPGGPYKDRYKVVLDWLRTRGADVWRMFKE